LRHCGRTIKQFRNWVSTSIGETVGYDSIVLTKVGVIN